MKTIRIEPSMTEEESDELSGTKLGDDAFDVLITGDTAVHDAETGDLILRYIPSVISNDLCRQGYAALKDAAKPTTNRGYAGGQVTKNTVGKEGTQVGPTGYREKKKDGTVSNTHRANSVESGIVGYFDRNPRHPYCRQTAYTMQNPKQFMQAMPFIERVNDVFRQEAPTRYQAQLEIAERTVSDFVIPGTVFTTITVNHNWQTAVHKDAGDYEPGMGVMTCLRSGNWEGCYLCLPRWRVACDMRTGGVLLADVHQWHGNTPIEAPVAERYERLSMVFYYREYMSYCGTAEQELDRAKRRKLGEAVKKDDLTLASEETTRM